MSAKRKRNYVSDLEKLQLQKKEDALFYKMLVAFAVAIVVEFALVMLYRAYYAGENFRPQIRLVQWVLLGITAAMAIVFWVGVFIKKARLSKTVFVIGAVCFAVAVQLRLINVSGILAIKVGCIIWPVLLLLYIIRLIYQPEFFVTALCCAGGIFAVWDAKKIFYINYLDRFHVMIAVVAVIVLMALVIFLAKRDNGGVLKGAWRLQFFGEKTDYRMMFLACGVSLVLLALYCLFEITLYLPVIVVFAAIAFVSAIYHTAKLM